VLWEAGAMSSILDEAANRHRMDAERTRLALSGVLGEEAKRREEDRAWCHQVSTRLPIAMWEVERLFARMNNSRARTLKHFTDAGCEFPPEIHQAAISPPKANCIYRGAVSADLAADSVVMNLPDGRSVVLPMEVREDGIYALIDEAAQAVIDDAVRVARERQEAVLMFGLFSY